jgi:hypothetical protein
LLANSGASQEDTLLKSIKYVAIALGANAGINPGINSGLKDTKEEAIKWGEENLKKNLQTPAMVVATVDTVLERVTSPIKSRELAPHQDDLSLVAGDPQDERRIRSGQGLPWSEERSADGQHLRRVIVTGVGLISVGPAPFYLESATLLFLYNSRGESYAYIEHDVGKATHQTSPQGR